MLEEQEAVLRQITDYVKERQADAVLLSGDLHDCTGMAGIISHVEEERTDWGREW